MKWVWIFPFVILFKCEKVRIFGIFKHPLCLTCVLVLASTIKKYRINVFRVNQIWLFLVCKRLGNRLKTKQSIVWRSLYAVIIVARVIVAYSCQNIEKTSCDAWIRLCGVDIYLKLFWTAELVLNCTIYCVENKKMLLGKRTHFIHSISFANRSTKI